MATKTQETTKVEMSLSQKLSRIQIEFKANKSRYNSFGKYNFRSAEDILEGLKPFNDKYGVYFTIREEMSIIFDTVPVIISTATIHDNNELYEIEATAIVGVDLQQKGMQTPQAFGSASSYGKKYALGNLLLIDDTQDSDAINTHGVDTSSKPSIDKARFDKAVQAIKAGSYSKDSLRDTFSLTADQEKALKTI